jgi:uncharacterized protein with HEPN domain
MQRDPESLQDMAIAASKILRFTEGLTADQFLVNEEKQSAVYGQLIIMGEAANRVTPRGQAALPQIPWRQIIGTRNRIVHGYDDIDWEYRLEHC